METLRPVLRLYLWGVSLAALALVVSAPLALTLTHGWSLPHLATAALFLMLTSIGDRMNARVNAGFFHSMSTVMLVASILVLPAPYCVLVALGAAVIVDMARPLPRYKYVFNVAHAVVVTGGTSLAVSWAAPPLPLWLPSHFLAYGLVLVLLGAVYATLDLGNLHMVMALATHHDAADPPPQTIKVLLLEGVSIGMGVVSAVAWAYHPAAFLLSLLPVFAVHAVFRTIEQDAARATALQRRTAQLERVIQAGQQFRVQQPRVDLIRPLAEQARAIAQASAVMVYLTDDGDPTVLARALVLPTGTPVDLPDRLPLPPEPTPSSVVESEEMGIILSLEVDGRVVGQLRVLGATGDDEDTRSALTLLATQAAIAVQNAALHERVQAQVFVDGLTGLPNQRAFHARLDEEIARCRRLGQPAGLLLADVDGLAAINEVGGLPVGDATLTAVATIIRHSVRAGDSVARTADDEFAVFLPAADRDETVATANRIQAAIRAGSGLPVAGRLSLGVAVLPLHGTSHADLVRAARQALAGAKALGKDRIAEPADGAGLLGGDVSHVVEGLAQANLATVKAMAAAVDAKDPYTQGHSQRVSRYAVALGRAMGLGAPDLARLELAALLHDVGKIAVPDAILKKEERLTEKEFAIITEHPVTGEQMLAGLPYLAKDILPAVRHHHERWDGRGYPDGLAGAALPLDAVILAVADSFDAMTSTRTYRPALAVHEAARRIREGSGTQFAPHVVLAFEQALMAGDLLIESNDPQAPACSA